MLSLIQISLKDSLKVLSTVENTQDFYLRGIHSKGYYGTLAIMSNTKPRTYIQPMALAALLAALSPHCIWLFQAYLEGKRGMKKIATYPLSRTVAIEVKGFQ